MPGIPYKDWQDLTAALNRCRARIEEGLPPAIGDMREIVALSDRAIAAGHAVTPEVEATLEKMRRNIKRHELMQLRLQGLL